MTRASLAYAASQTHFLYYPTGFVCEQVLATVLLLKISFAIPVWYLVHPTGTRATHITAIGLKPLCLEEALPIQETVENMHAKEVPFEKLMFTTKKIKRRGKKMENPTTQRESPVCAICDVIEHPTHIFQKLDELKPLLSSEVDIPTPRSLMGTILIIS